MHGLDKPGVFTTVSIIYTLYPDFSFVEEVKKANARSKKALASVSQQLLPPPRPV